MAQPSATADLPTRLALWRAKLAAWLARRRGSLATRITAIALLPMLVVGLTVGGLSIALREGDLEDSLRQRGLLLARTMASGADYGVFSGNTIALQNLADAVAREPAVLVAAILDRDGSVLVVSTSDAWRTDPPRPGQTPMLPQPRSMLSFQWVVGGEAIRVDDLESVPTQATNSRPQALVVMSTESLRYETLRFSLVVIAMLAAALAIAGLWARQMSRYIARPLGEVARAVEQIGHGDVGVRLEASPIQVIDQLAGGVNDMAERLDAARRTLEDRVLEATQLLTERTEEAERANMAKSRFLAAASHDLRQPMHALGMFVAALREQSLTAPQRELTERIDRSVAALGELLDSLLDISRLDAGAIEPRVASVRLQDVFDRVKTAFTEAATAKRLDLVVRRTPEWVQSDRILLERILNNLVSNAIRYTDRGSVMLCARVSGQFRQEVRLEVRDSGPGIDPAAHDQIFEEFVQLSNPERDRGKGLGLGLAIVRRLAALMDYPVGLASRPGAGSRFSVTVPRADEPRLADDGPERTSGPKSAPAGMPGSTEPRSQAFAGDAEGPATTSPSPLDPLTGARVLVIDDDPMVREALARLLRVWGMHVVALNGHRNLPEEMPVYPPPDLMVCDLRLADGLDGTDLLRNLRERFGLKVPAVLVTGDTDPERIAMARASGDPVVHKPLRPAQIRALVHALLRAQSHPEGKAARAP